MPETKTSRLFVVLMASVSSVAFVASVWIPFADSAHRQSLSQISPMHHAPNAPNAVEVCLAKRYGMSPADARDAEPPELFLLGIRSVEWNRTKRACEDQERQLVTKGERDG